MRSMICAAQSVYGIDQNRDMLGWGELGNAMPQIEHVSGPAAILTQDRIDLRANGFRGAEQYGGVEIAL